MERSKCKITFIDIHNMYLMHLYGSQLKWEEYWIDEKIHPKVIQH